MLGAELASLGTASAALVQRFRKKNEGFLTGVLQQGLKNGQFNFSGDHRATAALIFALLEGEMLVVRGAAGVKDFSKVAKQMLRLLQR
jgi:hypothetical protein